jgi:hypothetical protein
MADPLPPIDQNVKVPRGVQVTSAKAEEIHKQAYPSAETSQPPPESPAGATSAEEAPPPQPTHPTQPAPSLGPAASPPAAPAPPPETADDWKQRYTSLKGRFDAQAGQLTNTNNRLASLETLVSTLQAPAPRQAPAPQPQQQTYKKRVTDEEVKEYGEDLISVVQKAALDAIEPILDQRVSKVRSEVQDNLKNISTRATAVEREAATSQHQRLLDTLDKNLPNWRSVNKHPKFHNWLSLTDPFSGAIRKTLLNDAVRRGDAARAATFYSAFLAEEGVPAPAQGQQTSPPPPNGSTNGNGAGKVRLEDFAAPGRPAASGAAPVVPDRKEIITRAQISAFYNAKNKGQYSPDEAKRLEAEIFAAQKDGRIR